MEYATKLSDIIASLPEIMGGFLYSAEQGVFSNQAESVADASALHRIGLKLTKASSMLSAHFHDTGAIRVTFKDLVLFGQMLGEGNWIFLFHDPSLSPGMIKMTVQMAINIEAEEEPPAMEGQAIGDTEELPEAEPGAPATYETLMAEDSELRTPLTIIRDELAKFIGPVAELVMEDTVETWAQTTPAELANLPALIEALSVELDGNDDFEQFKDSLKDIQAEE